MGKFGVNEKAAEARAKKEASKKAGQAAASQKKEVCCPLYALLAPITGQRAQVSMCVSGAAGVYAAHLPPFSHPHPCRPAPDSPTCPSLRFPSAPQDDYWSQHDNPKAKRDAKKEEQVGVLGC